MNETENKVYLSGGDIYITDAPADAFRVASGTVLVFIVPLKNGEFGRRSFVYQAETNTVIPSFCYKDAEYCEWRFCLTALENAELEVIMNGSTKRLRERFIRSCNVTDYDTEGYDDGLVNRYRINIAREDGFIRRSTQERKEILQKTTDIIYNSFYRKGYDLSAEKTENKLYDAVSAVCEYQKISIVSFEKLREACGEKYTVSDIARLSHFAYREIVLPDKWEKCDMGAFLAFLEEGNAPAACLPCKNDRYILRDGDSECPVTSKVAETISGKAFTFCRPLPNEKLTAKKMLGFIKESIRPRDIAFLTLLSVIVTLIGLLTPVISQSLYDTYIPAGSGAVLFQLGAMMAAFMISNVMFSVVKSLVKFRMTSRISNDVQSAVYDRLFNLPESFFRKYDSADLAQRVMSSGDIAESAVSTIISLCISALIIVVYFTRMTGYSGVLSGLGLGMICIYSALYYFLSMRARKYSAASAEFEGRTSSLLYQFLGGISKIRIAGVEERALYEYFKLYVKLRENEEKKNRIENINGVIGSVSSVIFMIVLYTVIIYGNQDISVGSFIAFSSIFGSFSGTFIETVSGIISLRNLKPHIDRLSHVLETLPELSGDNELPGDISGAIEINNVTFAYSDDFPNVLDGISLNIKEGEYVGIVGSSGCGKSTLLKLLLGFEKPVSGKIYYDNKDIESVDKRELRKKMGVVLQGGKLISGSIFENITITAPSATLKDVQEVVKAVGLEDDIKQMPMGLHTVLSEDCDTISGGQQQRILIARAIISDPKILFFDEATSALDNVTQAMVCDTLEKMSSTRIVIAHRLSTIMKCDRIIVLDKGRIAEQGSYSELMELGGFFAKLANRQIA